MDGLGIRKADVMLAYALLRVALGFNILMHGVARILSGDAAFATGLTHTFQGSILPQPVVLAFGLGLPWIEAVIGLLLLLGLFSRAAIIAGSIMMVALTFGSALHQDWNITAIQLTYSVIYAALLAFNGTDYYALDVLLKRSRLQ